MDIDRFLDNFLDQTDHSLPMFFQKLLEYPKEVVIKHLLNFYSSQYLKRKREDSDLPEEKHMKFNR